MALSVANGSKPPYSKVRYRLIADAAYSEVDEQMGLLQSFL